MAITTENPSNTPDSAIRQFKSSPGLERFDELLKRLRQNNLQAHRKEINSVPSSNRRKAEPKDYRSIHLENRPLPPSPPPPATHESSDPHHQIIPGPRNDVHQPHIERASPSCSQLSTDLQSPSILLPSDHRQTSRSPLLTSPKSTSFIINLSSSSKLTASPTDHQLSQQTSSTRIPPITILSSSPPLTVSSDKLDWASLVEAAGKPDAEEDQLPDLTDWAPSQQDNKPSLRERWPTTIKVPSTLTSDHPQVSYIPLTLVVQSRPEILESIKPVKVQLGSKSHHTIQVVSNHQQPFICEPASQDDEPSHSNLSLTPNAIKVEQTSSSSFPAHSRVKPSTSISRPSPSSSSKLLNQQQKQSIAKLIIPILPVHSNFSQLSNPIVESKSSPSAGLLSSSFPSSSSSSSYTLSSSKHADHRSSISSNRTPNDPASDYCNDSVRKNSRHRTHLPLSANLSLSSSSPMPPSVPFTTSKTRGRKKKTARRHPLDQQIDDGRSTPLGTHDEQDYSQDDGRKTVESLDRIETSKRPNHESVQDGARNQQRKDQQPPNPRTESTENNRKNNRTDARINRWSNPFASMDRESEKTNSHPRQTSHQTSSRSISTALDDRRPTKDNDHGGKEEGHEVERMSRRRDVTGKSSHPPQHQHHPSSRNARWAPRAIEGCHDTQLKPNHHPGHKNHGHHVGDSSGTTGTSGSINLFDKLTGGTLLSNHHR